MNPPKCRLCGAEHWLRDPHQFASNAEPASNKYVRESAEKAVEKIAEAGKGSGTPRSVVDVGTAQAKQRWSREAYNAYQREYMRKRRGQASGV